MDQFQAIKGYIKNRIDYLDKTSGKDNIRSEELKRVLDEIAKIENQ